MERRGGKNRWDRASYTDGGRRMKERRERLRGKRIKRKGGMEGRKEEVRGGLKGG